MMGSLTLTPRVITKTNALRALQFLATNGNPKIRSESRSVLVHLKGFTKGFCVGRCYPREHYNFVMSCANLSFNIEKIVTHNFHTRLIT
ncbi:hypothetical protein YC2023_110122 [Brassica napus]